MNPLIIKVEAQDDFSLQLFFSNGEKKIFDVAPYLNKGVFHELKDLTYFKQVKVSNGYIEWPNEQDFSNDTLYLESH